MKKEKITKGLDFDLRWGIKGLKMSLGLLILVLVFLIVLLLINQNSFSALAESLLVLPSSKEDYLFIFAGGILFIAVPFVLGIKVGSSLKKK